MSNLEHVNAAQAREKVEQGAILVDVREPAEFNSAHIAGASLHPLGEVSAEAIAHYQKPIVIYCQKGMRGTKACEKILAENPSIDIVNLSGGIEAWSQAGFSTQKGESSGLSLDRQVQLTIGLLVLSFSILSTTLHPNFIYGAMFMGAGLIFAGISGFCSLTRVMAIAPWNK